MVTAIVRDPENCLRIGTFIPGKLISTMPMRSLDVVGGHDAVISAFNPGWGNPGIFNLQVKARKPHRWHEESGVKRLLFVGGAGSFGSPPGAGRGSRPAFPPNISKERWRQRSPEPAAERIGFGLVFLLPPGSHHQANGRQRLARHGSMLKDANGKAVSSTQDYAGCHDRRGGTAGSHPTTLHGRVLVWGDQPKREHLAGANRGGDLMQHDRHGRRFCGSSLHCTPLS